MSSATCGQPLSSTHLPADRVVELTGLTADQLAVGLDRYPIPQLAAQQGESDGVIEALLSNERTNEGNPS